MHELSVADEDTIVAQARGVGVLEENQVAGLQLGFARADPLLYSPSMPRLIDLPASFATYQMKPEQSNPLGLDPPHTVRVPRNFSAMPATPSVGAQPGGAIFGTGNVGAGVGGLGAEGALGFAAAALAGAAVGVGLGLAAGFGVGLAAGAAVADALGDGDGLGDGAGVGADTAGGGGGTALTGAP